MANDHQSILLALSDQLIAARRDNSIIALLTVEFQAAQHVVDTNGDRAQIWMYAPRNLAFLRIAKRARTLALLALVNQELDQVDVTPFVGRMWDSANQHLAAVQLARESNDTCAAIESLIKLRDDLVASQALFDKADAGTHPALVGA